MEGNTLLVKNVMLLNLYHLVCLVSCRGVLQTCKKEQVTCSHSLSFSVVQNSLFWNFYYVGGLWCFLQRKEDNYTWHLPNEPSKEEKQKVIGSFKLFLKCHNRGNPVGVLRRLKLSPIVQVRKVSLKAGVVEPSPTAQKQELGYVRMGKKTFQAWRIV